jgi:enoyl-[acyl-carrier protein] reductase I
MSTGPSFLTGRRGVVLGVSTRSSVGFHTARALCALGADITVTHRASRREHVSELARELGCATVELDVRDELDVARAFAEIGRRQTGIDFLVHAVVHVPDGVLSRPITEISAEEFGAVMEVGVRSLLSCARHALPLLALSDAPRVVTLLSPGADRALQSYHAIGIAKSALAAAVRYLALELGPRRVLCNAVNFSIIETDAARRVIGTELAERTRQHLVKRAFTRVASDYDDVTSAIAFLASPLCRNMTGESLTVDGGFSLGYA